jgi:hypothetical protein
MTTAKNCPFHYINFRGQWNGQFLAVVIQNSKNGHCTLIPSSSTLIAMSIYQLHYVVVYCIVQFNETFFPDTIMGICYVFPTQDIIPLFYRQKIGGKLSRFKKMIDWDLFHLKRLSLALRRARGSVHLQYSASASWKVLQHLKQTLEDLRSLI